MITAGIPTTLNEEKVIAKSINSVLSQLSKNDEIIIVASASTKGTLNEIKKIKDKRVKLIIEKERNGKASALNIIINEAKGDIIVQTDGDVEVAPDAIRNLLPHFKDNNIGAVSGNPIPIIPKDNLFYDWTIMSYRKIGELREQEVKNKTFNVHLSGYLLAFRKKALPKVPFKKGAIDAWMGRIIRDNGYKLTYESNARVYVKAPTNIKDFIAQKMRVRAGFIFMPKREAPRSMKREIFYLPSELLRIPVRDWPKFILSGWIYLYSWCKGYYYAKKDKSLQEIWKVPKSTKM